MTQPIVLITRSIGDAAPYADKVRARGWEAMMEPMLRIEPVGILPDIAPYDALVFTSAHAVDAFAAQSPHRNIPVFTVGDSTADHARGAGFENVTSAAGDANDLKELLEREAPEKILYLRGDDVAQEFDGIDSAVVYKAHPVEKFTESCFDALRSGRIRNVMFFSARGGAAFVDLCRASGLEGAVSGIKALCISGAVLESVSVLPWSATRIAASPSRAAMLALLDA